MTFEERLKWMDELIGELEAARSAFRRAISRLTKVETVEDVSPALVQITGASLGEIVSIGTQLEAMWIAAHACREMLARPAPSRELAS